LNPENRWCKLAGMIPWETAEERYIESLSLFPHSRNAAETALSLPIHPYLGDEEIQQIIDDVRGSFAGAR